MRVTFTRAGVLRGLRRGVPLLLGLIPFGLVVGIVSDGRGLTLAETVLMSLVVFAGASQLLALELWTTPPDALAAAVAAFVVNVRMLPYGAALSFWLDALRGWRLLACLFVTVDHAVPLGLAEHRAGGRDAGFLLGLGIIAWLAWAAATAAGHVLGNTVALPAGHPLFFAATATFVAVTVPLWRGVRQDLLPWLAAAGVALGTQALGLPAPVPLLAGALAGASLATWRGLRREARAP